MQQRPMPALASAAAALLVVACCCASAGAARAARGGSKAAWNGDADDSADAALLFVHNKLAASSLERAHLREEVEQAQQNERDLAQKIEDGRRLAEAAEQQAQQAMALKTKEDASQLDLERRRERLLEDRLHNVSQAFTLRGKGLAAARDALSAARGERTRLLAALNVAKGNASSLAGRLHLTASALSGVRRELVASQQDAETVRHSLRAEEAKLKKAEADEQMEVAAHQKALQKEEEQVRRLREDSSQKDAALRDLKGEMSKAVASSEANLAIERAEKMESQQLLEEERKKEERQVNLLTEALKTYERRMGEERQQEQQLAQRVSTQEADKRKEFANLTGQVRTEEARGRQLLGERTALQEELRGNASRVQQLEAQVALLRRRVKDGDAARQEAEASAGQAKEGMERAQAVARQLAGTVPRLLEQAQKAHQARDAEKALRAQAQAKAKRQLRQLQRQYASVVQGEIDQASSAIPGPDVGAKADVDAAPQEESAVARSPDLARDSLGLGNLLTED